MGNLDKLNSNTCPALTNINFGNLLNGLISGTLNSVKGNPALAIKTNFDVENGNAFDVAINGILYTVSANTTCDIGTAATFPAGTWAIFTVSVDTAGSLTATWDTNSSSGYTTELLAIAALPDPPDDETMIGYVTVQASAGNSFTAGTDALKTGTGGNVAQNTNYYNVAVKPNNDLSILE